MEENTNITLYNEFGNVINLTKERGVNLDKDFFHSASINTTVSQKDIESRPYQYHALIYSLCTAILKNVSRLKFVLYYKSTPSDLIVEHEVLDVLRKPNWLMTKTSLIQAILLNLFLPANYKTNKKGTNGGQCFLIPFNETNKNREDKYSDSVDLMRGEVPTSFFPFNDNFISPVTTEDANTDLKQLNGWTFKVPEKGGEGKHYLPNELIRIYQFNPYDWLKGLSTYEPSMMALAQDIKSDIFNANLFDNNAIPSGVLKTDSTLSPQKRTEHLRHWYETMSGQNAQRTAILERGLDYKHIGFTMADMQYQEMKKFLDERLISTWGLNKIALGNYEQINRATIVEGRKMLWNDTYLPIADIIIDALNSQWIQYVDKGLRIKFLTDNIQALQEDYTARSKSAAILVEKCLFPPVLACRINGIPLTDKDIKMYPWLEEKPSKNTTPENGKKEDDKEDDKDKKTLKKISINNPVIESKLNNKQDTKKQSKEDYLFWLDYVKRVLDPGEKSMKNDFIKFFYRQRNLMQDKVDVWLKDQKSKQIKENNSITGLIALDKSKKPKASDFLLDKDEENKKLLKMYSPKVKPQMELEQIKLEEELGELFEFDVNNDMVNEFIDKRKKQLFQINNTTFKAVEGEVTEVIDKGVKDRYTPQKMAQEIKKVIGKVGEIRKNQSKTIARTEIGTISSSTRFKAFKMEGIEYHQWITAGDEAVRMSHRKENSQVVKVGKKFPNTDLRFPLDPVSNDLGEIINCRCVTVVVLDKN